MQCVLRWVQAVVKCMLKGICGKCADRINMVYASQKASRAKENRGQLFFSYILCGCTTRQNDIYSLFSQPKKNTVQRTVLRDSIKKSLVFVVVSFGIIDGFVSFHFKLVHGIPSFLAADAVVVFGRIDPVVIIIFDVFYLHLQFGRPV